MTLFNFIEKFPNEYDCIEHFRDIKEDELDFCNKCGNEKYKWLPDTNQFLCEQCGNKISIKNGTLMEKSKLPLKYWFITIYLFTTENKPINAVSLQKQLGYPELEPISEMLNVLDLFISKIDSEYSFEMLLLACAKNQTNPSLSSTC